MDHCSYCGGALGIDRIESAGGGFRHYSKIACCDHLLIQRKALELQNDDLKKAVRAHIEDRAFDRDLLVELRAEVKMLTEGDKEVCEVNAQLRSDLDESNRLLGEAHELLRAYMTRFWGDYAGHCAGCKDLPCWTDHLLERTEPEKRNHEKGEK